MPLTETTRQHAIEWKAFVGPLWQRDDDPAFYDWSQLNAGATFTPAADTVLVFDIDADSGTVPLASDTGIPLHGGCWVGPGAAGESWEYLSYAARSGGTLTELTRETVDAEQSGVHSAGAVVRFWWKLGGDDGTLTVQRSADSKLSLMGWQAVIRGANVPQAALRLYHLVVITKREATTGDWGAWTIAQVGWITDAKMKDGPTGSRWEIQVDSLAGLLAKLPAPGVQVGPANDARGGSASGSTELAAWYKEAGSGELASANPDLSPSAAIDGNPATPYVTERYLGSANEATDNPGVNTVHTAAYVGQGNGYDWIKANVVPDKNWRWYRFTTQTGRQIEIIGGPSSALWGPGINTLLLLENENLFEAENPGIRSLPGYAHREISTSNGITLNAGSGTVEDWWDDLSAASGRLIMTVEFGAGETLVDDVSWGAGGFLPAPTAGQTIRRIYAGNRHTADGWRVDNTYIAGNPPQGTASPLHWVLERAPLGLTLTNSITDGLSGHDNVGDTLYISAGDTPATNGLDAFGTLQIGAEQITYSAKIKGGVIIAARCVNGSVPVAHTAGDSVLAVEGGKACDAWPLAAFQVVRPAGKPTLKTFDVFGCRWSTPPPMPNDDKPYDISWSADWELVTSVRNNALATYTHTHTGSNRRYRWLCAYCSEMTADPYRFMINEFRSLADGSAYDPGAYLASGTVADVAAKILDGVGIPVGARLAAVGGDNTPSISGITTAPDMAASVLSDLADMSGCAVIVEADSKVRTQLHPWFGGTPVISRTWTKTTAKQFEPEHKSGRDTGQIRVVWKALDGLSSGVARYPANPDTFGKVIQVGPYFCIDQAAADVAAEKRYWLARLPFGATVEAAGAPLDAQPCRAEGVNWLLDPDMLAMQRTYLLDSVDLRIERAALTVVVHGVQYGREDER